MWIVPQRTIGRQTLVRRVLTETELAGVIASGWLSRQPEAFREEVLRRCLVEDYAGGATVYHAGDSLGGIHGLARGMLTLTAAPGASLPRMIHIGQPGFWIGEGPDMTAEPRRVSLGAAVASRVLYLKLEAMEQICEGDPEARRRFGQIPMANLDTMLRVVHDLLLKDADSRIAALLLRVAPVGTTIPLGQAEIGDMACATRKQVNYALRRFTAAGWVAHGYRSVTVRDPAGLRALVATGDEG